MLRQIVDTAYVSSGVQIASVAADWMDAAEDFRRIAAIDFVVDQSQVPWNFGLVVAVVGPQDHYPINPTSRVLGQVVWKQDEKNPSFDSGLVAL